MYLVSVLMLNALTLFLFSWLIGSSFANPNLPASVAGNSMCKVQQLQGLSKSRYPALVRGGHCKGAQRKGGSGVFDASSQGGAQMGNEGELTHHRQSGSWSEGVTGCPLHPASPS